MRSFLFILSTAFLLAACSARSELEVSAGAGGSSSAGTGGSGGGSMTQTSLSQINASCAPNDGPALTLTIDGLAGCPTSMAGVSSISFSFWDPILLDLEAGTTVEIGGGFTSGVEAQRVTVVNGAGMNVDAAIGTVTFDTFVKETGATGTYDVSFVDGSTAQGSFEATWCPSEAFCG